MRFVDINELELPIGWQQRADQSLNDLRAEVTSAKNAARLAGQDPVIARRNAITAGLEVTGRIKVWRDLNANLSALTNGKCWYSESRNPTSDKNVDHFRPKNRVDGDPHHEGYWWLAFSSRNYRYSSQWCNQRRVDKNGGTSGGKWDQFPLCQGSVRARQETDDLDLERPELLDPIDPNDWKLLTFRPDGYPTPARQSGTEEFKRAETSIEVYHLHCKELVESRRAVAGTVQRLIQDLERLRPKIDDPKLRVIYTTHQIALLRAIHPNSEYSAAALAYARAEIYTLEHGHQVKREWLQEMLS